MGKAQKKIEEFGLTTCSNINKVVSAVWRNAAVSGYSIWLFVVAIRFHCVDEYIVSSVDNQFAEFPILYD